VSALTVRASTEADVARCAEIYGHHVLHGTASFEVDPPDVAEMGKRRDGGARSRPALYLVAEKEGRLLGYAYAGLYRTRPAYRFTVENSIYIDKDAVGQGVGRALLVPLIDLCARDGRRQMIAVIGDSQHVASVNLHASCGFAMVGTLKSVGFKFGRWLDSVLMERPLGPGDTTLPEAGK
jgi:L-amino acid N-acyltransferase YncA